MNRIALQSELANLSRMGINLNACKGFIENGMNKDAKGNFIPNNYHDIALDAGLVTSANSTVPVALLSYWDPKAIDILTAILSAEEIYDTVKKGDFADQQVHFRIQERTGSTQPYSDFANDGMTDMNYNWPYRDVYRFMTNISVGDLEAEMAGKAQINEVANKQKAAASIISIDMNRFLLLGVEGKQTFGSLNDPSLLAAIAPLANSAGDVEWVDKNALERYNDILYMFEELSTQSGGQVNQKSELTLSVSPKINVQLGSATEFNVSVTDLLNKFFTDLKIVIVPELEAADGTQTMQLKADNVLGQATGECNVVERFRAYPVFRKESSITQKVAAATTGTVIARPIMIVTMTGM